MNVFTLKTWLIFYLLSFATLLWVIFLTSTGFLLWISLLLVVLVVGVNFTAVCFDVKRHHRRIDIMRRIHQDTVPAPVPTGAGE
jgi:Flp pilus assembly protein TadB